MRAAIEITDAGQAAARAALRGGATELELWTETRAAMERHAGSRLPVLADFVTGERTAEIGGPPTARAVGDGDLLLVDLVPRLGAYWADSCATVALGEPPDAAKAAHAAALSALESAKAAIRPGVRAGDVDRAARAPMEALGGYPHHTGHGLGVTVHEAPRIIPGSEAELAEGMVLALEPGAYGDGWGVRVEQVVVVTVRRLRGAVGARPGAVATVSRRWLRRARGRRARRAPRPGRRRRRSRARTAPAGRRTAPPRDPRGPRR